jgi:lipoprotein NlpD
MFLSARNRWSVPVLVGVLLLAGCGTRSVNHAPVEERGGSTSMPPGSTSPAPGAGTAPVPAAVVLPGAENAGKPGYYTVRPGDTLIRIGLDTGQNWRDIARWSNLENPNLIEVGQVLRVVPPTASSAAATVPPAIVGAPVAGAPAAGASAPASGAVSRPVQSSTVAPVVIASVPPSTQASGAAATPSGAVPPASAPTSATTGGDEDIGWIWPARGSIVGSFDEVKNKGLDIAGAAGDPVVAAADGTVVYVGASLRGYGNLVILKHNNTYLTAYAHNQTLLVKEDQRVRKGQKIAEMGSTDADRVKLHFEVRRQGKPVDPSKYLPAR